MAHEEKNVEMEVVWDGLTVVHKHSFQKILHLNVSKLTTFP